MADLVYAHRSRPAAVTTEAITTRAAADHELTRTARPIDAEHRWGIGNDRAVGEAAGDTAPHGSPAYRGRRHAVRVSSQQGHHWLEATAAFGHESRGITNGADPAGDRRP